MPTGTAPDRLTFCTLGPAPTIVVSCRIGSTVDMFHSRGSTAVITSLMFLVPCRAASMLDCRLVSQIPVRFDGACTSAPGSGARLGAVDVGVVGRPLVPSTEAVAGLGLVVVAAPEVDTAVASSAG